MSTRRTKNQIPQLTQEQINEIRGRAQQIKQRNQESKERAYNSKEPGSRFFADSKNKIAYQDNVYATEEEMEAFEQYVQKKKAEEKKECNRYRKRYGRPMATNKKPPIDVDIHPDGTKATTIDQRTVVVQWKIWDQDLFEYRWYRDMPNTNVYLPKGLIVPGDLKHKQKDQHNTVHPEQKDLITQQEQEEKKKLYEAELIKQQQEALQRASIMKEQELLTIKENERRANERKISEERRQQLLQQQTLKREAEIKEELAERMRKLNKRKQKEAKEIKSRMDGHSVMINGKTIYCFGGFDKPMYWINDAAKLIGVNVDHRYVKEFVKENNYQFFELTYPGLNQDKPLRLIEEDLLLEFILCYGGEYSKQTVQKFIKELKYCICRTQIGAYYQHKEEYHEVGTHSQHFVYHHHNYYNRLCEELNIKIDLHINRQLQDILDRLVERLSSINIKNHIIQKQDETGEIQYFLEPTFIREQLKQGMVWSKADFPENISLIPQQNQDKDQKEEKQSLTDLYKEKLRYVKAKVIGLQDITQANITKIPQVELYEKRIERLNDQLLRFEKYVEAQRMTIDIYLNMLVADRAKLDIFEAQIEQFNKIQTHHDPYNKFNVINQDILDRAYVDLINLKEHAHIVSCHKQQSMRIIRMLADLPSSRNYIIHDQSIFNTKINGDIQEILNDYPHMQPILQKQIDEYAQRRTNLNHVRQHIMMPPICMKVLEESIPISLKEASFKMNQEQLVAYLAKRDVQHIVFDHDKNHPQRIRNSIRRRQLDVAPMFLDGSMTDQIKMINIGCDDDLDDSFEEDTTTLVDVFLQHNEEVLNKRKEDRERKKEEEYQQLKKEKEQQKLQEQLREERRRQIHKGPGLPSFSDMDSDESYHDNVIQTLDSVQSEEENKKKQNCENVIQLADLGGFTEEESESSKQQSEENSFKEHENSFDYYEHEGQYDYECEDNDYLEYEYD